MNKYNRSQFLTNFMLYSLTALTCSLLCSYPYWFPSLCCSMKRFLFISLPNVWYFFFNPKCLFIVGNAIVIILVGESKIARSQLSPSVEIYGDYVERSQSHRRLSIFKEKKEERKMEMNLIEESLNKNEEEQEDQGKQEDKREEDEQEEEKDAKNVDVDDGGGGDEKERAEEEEPGLPVEELNKRVEEFIARVNKQRRLEAKSYISNS